MPYEQKKQYILNCRKGLFFRFREVIIAGLSGIGNELRFIIDYFSRIIYHYKSV